MGDVILLGPQRLTPTVGPVLDALKVRGRPCVISAGWQEREGELDELAGHLHVDVVDLGLYRRAELVYADDPDLNEALRERQDRLKDAQRFYRLRLLAALRAVRDLDAAKGDAGLLRRERLAAMRALRALDRHHLETIRRVHGEFADRCEPASRPVVHEHRREIGARLKDAGALLIAGGHVQVLLNRLRLFDIGKLLPDIPVIGWSAGAMVLSPRIVLYHDDAPHGGTDAEILDMGLSAYPGVVPLPHANRRLHLDDPARVALFARRFSPAHCVALDDGAQLHWNGRTWTHAERCRRLTRVGRLVEVRL